MLRPTAIIPMELQELRGLFDGSVLARIEVPSPIVSCYRTSKSTTMPMSEVAFPRHVTRIDLPPFLGEIQDFQTLGPSDLRLPVVEGEKLFDAKVKGRRHVKHIARSSAETLGMLCGQLK